MLKSSFYGKTPPLAARNDITSCHYIRSTVIDSLPCCSSSTVHLFYIVFLSADSEDEKVAKKSKKSPKEKQKTSKLEPAPKKDPVQYVSETGD